MAKIFFRVKFTTKYLPPLVYNSLMIYKRGEAMTVIYADSLWMVNFSMDFLALYICGRFLKIPMKPMRLVFAATIGGIYGVVSAFLEFGIGAVTGGIISVIGAVACVLAMTGLGFGAKGLAAVKSALTYTAVNMGLGGVMTALYSFAGKAMGFFGVGRQEVTPSASPLFFAAAALISGIVSLAYGKFKNKSAEKRKVTAELTLLGKSTPLSLLCDSGNLLRDPFSGKPVIVISKASLDGILPSELDFAKLDLSVMGELKARYIPVSGVAGQGMFLCFCPDKISVEGRQIDGAVAIDSDGGDFGGCDGVLPQSLINV